MGRFDFVLGYGYRSNIQMLKFINDDCLNVLATMEDCSIDMILTSPPYLHRRKTPSFSYGDIRHVR